MSVNEGASAKRWVKINRKRAVHLYWLLEAYDNLWSFTTLSAKDTLKARGEVHSGHSRQLGKADRVVMIRSTKSQEKEMVQVLSAICEAVDAEIFTHDVFSQ
jgi:hypothetical protein